MKKAQLLTSALLVSGVFALTACGDKKPADQAGANAAPPAPTINTIQKIKDSGKVVVGHRESSMPISMWLMVNQWAMRWTFVRMWLSRLKKI